MVEHITVKIIFYGLLALVPDRDGSGLTAIVADHQAAHHLPLVTLVEGTCAGGPCVSGSLTTHPYSLHLEIEPPGGSLDAQQGGHAFDKVPYAGKVKANCLSSGDECPVISRFSVPIGTITTCHLAHDGADPQWPLLFTQNSTQKVMLGDAVEVAFKVPKPRSGSVTVPLAATTFAGASAYRVTLRPSMADEIVLVVAGVNPEGTAGNPQPDAPLAHYGAFKNMLSTLSAFKTPYYRSVGSRTVSHYCEEWIVRSVGMIGLQPRAFPHNKERCVPARLSPP